jgi:hypothetical protein
VTNPLLRAVQEYIDDERAYVSDVEGEIQRLERALADERRQTQRRMIAALYWWAGDALTWIRHGDSHDQRRYWRHEANVLQGAALAMEAACAR